MDDQPDFMFEDLARRVKATYERYKRLIPSHDKYRAGKRWDPVFMKVAKLISKLEADPDQYVRMQFEYIKPFPMPNMLLGNNAIARYQDMGKKITEDAAEHIAYQLELLAERVAAGAKLADLVSDFSFQLDPIVRAIAAKEVDNYEVFNRVFDSAVLQLRLSPTLLDTYADLLPIEIVVRSRERE